MDDDYPRVLDEAEACLESHAFLGEAMPSFRPGFGPDQMAAFLGAPLTISEGSDQTSWSEKIVADWERNAASRDGSAAESRRTCAAMHWLAADT